jgi:hypothetical protein
LSARSPVVTLNSNEGARLRAILRDVGVGGAREALGNIDECTLFKAAAEVPVSRLTAEVIRGRLDRI